VGDQERGRFRHLTWGINSMCRLRHASLSACRRAATLIAAGQPPPLLLLGRVAFSGNIFRLRRRAVRDQR